MTTRVFNFLWLGLDLPAKKDPKDGIHQPLPEACIEKLRMAGTNNPDADVVLWVDSKRLTERQMAYLKDKAETGMDNVRVKNLRCIPAYRNQRLYNKGEKSRHWRNGSKDTLIWRQVDCAKILICLQGAYDQTFFADFGAKYVPSTIAVAPLTTTFKAGSAKKSKTKATSPKKEPAAALKGKKP